MANPAQERDRDVVSYKAFTGLRNDRPVERFELPDLEICDNADIDKSGMVSLRNGRTLISGNAVHSLWTDDKALGLVVQGTTLNKLNPDHSLTVVRSGLTPALRMMYTKVNDIVYFANGRENGAFENGATRTWGIAVPPRPGVAVSLGAMPAGDYQYVTTYVRNDGQESGALSARVVTVPANGALVFTLTPSADPGVQFQNVYISEPNGDVLFQALQVPNATLSATYAGDTLEFTSDLSTQFLSPPPVGHIVGYYRGRMFVGVGDTLFYSEEYAYERFDLRKYVSLNGRITLIAPMEDKEQSDKGNDSGLFLGTDRSCGVLVGSRPEDFQYVPKTNYGAILGAVTYVDGSLYGDRAAGARELPVWLTTDGICIGMPRMEIQNLTRAKYRITAAGQGAALFQADSHRLIMTSNH